ncbi:hypothetical protein [Tenacibaculum aiptasiae]|uniref:hypothetical protein n=1 Tax=Tenacibaculum aiptasiae TaxID=426481 RepID=UPI00232FA7C2|nr:hypothetical protein [Tenacibaculum aiptasiae]
MISILIAILFLGCYLFYNTSQKTTIVSNSYIEERIRSNEQLSKILGGSFFLITLIITTIHFGLFSGILFWLVTLTMLMSLLIVTAPLKLVNYKTLVALLFVLLLIEFIF